MNVSYVTFFIHKIDNIDNIDKHIPHHSDSMDIASKSSYNKQAQGTYNPTNNFNQAQASLSHSNLRQYFTQQQPQSNPNNYKQPIYNSGIVLQNLQTLIFRLNVCIFFLYLYNSQFFLYNYINI